ncbi:BCCT family transporter [Francisella philomiragia]|uniref:Betaine/carnitine/choline transporter (BCCT) family protein n=1 Tax=Francisella philomiragia subsp. philomiragia (strain ATCC 25017 / CCUG 19701 / FSC 153 / O\|nr:BCCT family transporter [Francisella philomiragia]AJI48000.1 transporter, betaine/carnitine/choline transporter family protein [Francisella philomiragia]AJI49883.1 transporter, betaine/carnitine/choline transporter family protein [Francisella philomiragia]MBK2021202.1 BCCT family transporter [Francisella philomiragia]MBK2030744.1 BCCT family transporter [Francisella philomiragia]MBK2263237.1 BCCT family transporter [Francisella philomiragia]
MQREKGAYAPVFYPAIILAIVLSLSGIFYPNQFASHIQNLQNLILEKFGWAYILAMSVFLCLCLILMFSRFGDIKLGQEHDLPEYSNISWFAMLFAAGMGIGLMFYGVAEPLKHFLAPPNMSSDELVLVKEAMNTTFFHWGIEAWSVYAIVGLSLAYFAYRHDLPLLPRSVLYPILGRHIYGPLGHAIDVFAVLGRLFGVATSLGFGAMQVSAGMSFLTGLPDTVNMQVIYIVVIVALATISVGLGLEKGIKALSNFNIILAVLLLVFILLLGNSSVLVRDYIQNIGYYLSTIVNQTFNLYAYNQENQEWLKSWTLFYWGWWIAWSPFVGMFIAKVSRGRTIRQFTIGVLFIPVGFTFLWMTVFGNSAIEIAMNGNGEALIDAANNNIPVALFEFLQHFPFSTLLSVLAVFLIVTFFVTSADSGALVIDILATGNAKKSITLQRIAWSVLSGLLAISLILAGGLQALQSATIISAFPLLFILFLMCVSLIKSLRLDYLRLKSIETHSTVVQFAKANTSWQKRLEAIAHKPSKDQAIEFLQKDVTTAIIEVADEMEKNGINTEVIRDHDHIQLAISIEGNEDFIYSVMLRSYQSKLGNYNRVEVLLSHGGQYYDIMGYSKDQVIADIVNQYDKHLHYLHLVVADKDILN